MNIEKGEKISMCEIAEELENQGIQKINQLYATLLEDGRKDEMIRAIKEADLRKKLMDEYGI